MSDIDLFGDATTIKRGVSSHERSRDGGDEWLTPPSLIEALGPFDLDPCAPIANPLPCASRRYSIEQDGLRQKWEGRIWLNPPYSNTGVWMHRLAEHGQGTALLFARTETAVWQDYIWPHATAMLFLRGRLTFHLSDGRPAKHPAGAPSVLIAYGRRDALALGTSGIAGRYVEVNP